MRKEFFDGVPLFWIDIQQVRDQILGRFGNVIPPGREESVLASRHFFCENLYVLVVERGEATQKSIEDAAHSPHIDTFRVPLVIHDLRRSVTDGSAWCDCLVIPNHLREAKICNLNLANTTRADTRSELPLILFIFLTGLLMFRACARFEGNWVEEEVLWFDITTLSISSAPPRK